MVAKKSGGGSVPLRRASAGPVVPPYDMLKDAILSGEFAPSQALVEASLAEWCGVSRTPVREALRRLEQDGLIHHKNGSLVVRERSPEDILDVYETRIALEATAARVAAERRTDHDLRLMRVLLDRAGAIDTSDTAAMAEANRTFHRAVWRASRNESLIDALQRLRMHLGKFPDTTLAVPGRWEATLREHTELTDALERRDAAAAYSIAERDVAEARDIRLELFAEHQTG